LSRKKRFKKQTIAKLQLFIQKDSYNGQINFSKFKRTTSTLNNNISINLQATTHYNNVTKKKIYNTNYTLC
jgi:hypothetical protein